MIHEAIERADAIIKANFATDMETLEGSKSLSGIEFEAEVHARRRAADMIDRSAVPVIGLLGRAARTTAKQQAKRDAEVLLEAEYICRGTQESKVRQQTELAAEAVCMAIDRMQGAGGVSGAGEPLTGIDIELGGDYELAGQDRYEGSCVLRWTMVTRDEL